MILLSLSFPLSSLAPTRPAIYTDKQSFLPLARSSIIAISNQNGNGELHKARIAHGVGRRRLGLAGDEAGHSALRPAAARRRRRRLRGGRDDAGEGEDKQVAAGGTDEEDGVGGGNAFGAAGGGAAPQSRR